MVRNEDRTIMTFCSDVAILVLVYKFFMHYSIPLLIVLTQNQSATVGDYINYLNI